MLRWTKTMELPRLEPVTTTCPPGHSPDVSPVVSPISPVSPVVSPGHKAGGQGRRVCMVCGDRALAHNFGALTCETCKAFFRRNARKPQQQQCAFQGQCVIEKHTRRFCPACRLSKCFAVGMMPQLILDGEARKARMSKRRRKRSEGEQQQYQNTSSSPPANQHSPPAALNSPEVIPRQGIHVYNVSLPAQSPSPRDPSHYPRIPNASPQISDASPQISDASPQISDASPHNPSPSSQTHNLFSPTPPDPQTLSPVQTSMQSVLQNSCEGSDLIRAEMASFPCQPSSASFAGVLSTVGSLNSNAQCSLAPQPPSLPAGNMSTVRSLDSNVQCSLTPQPPSLPAGIMSSVCSADPNAQSQSPLPAVIRLQLPVSEREMRPEGSGGSTLLLSRTSTASGLPALSFSFMDAFLQQALESSSACLLGPQSSSTGYEGLAVQDLATPILETSSGQERSAHESPLSQIEDLDSPRHIQGREFCHVSRQDLPSDMKQYWRLTVDERREITELTHHFQTTLTAITDPDSGRRPTALPCQADYWFIVEKVLHQVIRFAKNIPEFSSLEQKDQITILKGSALPCMTIDSAAIFLPEEKCWTTMLGRLSAQHFPPLIHSMELNDAMHDFCGMMKSMVKNDISVYALLHCIMLFDPALSSATDQQQVNRVRDKYVILLKHYLDSQLSFLHSDRYFNALMDSLCRGKHLAQQIVTNFRHSAHADAKPLTAEIIAQD